MAEIFVLQHIQCETLGTIGQALESSGLVAESIRTFGSRARLKPIFAIVKKLAPQCFPAGQK
jgi:hypothetical protein